MYDKIQNPVTGRYVKVTGRVGRRVIKRYLKELENRRGGASEAEDSAVYSDVPLNTDDSSDDGSEENELRDKDWVVLRDVPSALRGREEDRRQLTLAEERANAGVIQKREVKAQLDNLERKIEKNKASAVPLTQSESSDAAPRGCPYQVRGWLLDFEVCEAIDSLINAIITLINGKRLPGTVNSKQQLKSIQQELIELIHSLSVSSPLSSNRVTAILADVREILGYLEFMMDPPKHELTLFDFVAKHEDERRQHSPQFILNGMWTEALFIFKKIIKTQPTDAEPFFTVRGKIFSFNGGERMTDEDRIGYAEKFLIKLIYDPKRRKKHVYEEAFDEVEEWARCLEREDVTIIRNNQFWSWLKNNVKPSLPKIPSEPPPSFHDPLLSVTITTPPPLLSAPPSSVSASPSPPPPSPPFNVPAPPPPGAARIDSPSPPYVVKRIPRRTGLLTDIRNWFQGTPRHPVRQGDDYWG